MGWIKVLYLKGGTLKNLKSTLLTQMNTLTCNINCGYCKYRTPHITVINLWDKIEDSLLLSRHDYLFIRRGEVGMGKNNKGTSTSSSNVGSPKRKVEIPNSGLKDVIKHCHSLTNSY